MFVKLKPITPNYNLKPNLFVFMMDAKQTDLWCYECYSTGTSKATTEPHHQTNTTSNSADELNDSLLDFSDELLQLDTLNMNTSIHTPASEDLLTTDV